MRRAISPWPPNTRNVILRPIRPTLLSPRGFLATCTAPKKTGPTPRRRMNAPFLKCCAKSRLRRRIRTMHGQLFKSAPRHVAFYLSMVGSCWLWVASANKSFAAEPAPKPPPAARGQPNTTNELEIALAPGVSPEHRRYLLYLYSQLQRTEMVEALAQKILEENPGD